MGVTIDTSLTALPYATKQRMAAARAAGMSEQDIQANIKQDLYEESLKRQQAQATAQPKQKGNFWTSMIPTATSLLGVGLAPFTGGGSLALLGLGAAGGLIGKGIQNVVEDKPILSNPKGYLGEAAFGAIPGVLKGAKVLKLAPKGAKMAALMGKTGAATTGLAEQAVKTTGKAGTVATKLGKQPGNILQRAGRSMRQSVVSPKSPVSPRMASNQRRIMETLNRLGFKGSASRQLNQLDDASRMLSTQVDDALKANKTVVKMTGKDGVLNQLKATATNNLDATPAVKREISRTLKNVASVADDGSMIKLRQAQKSLGNRLGRAFDKLKKGGVLTDKESVDLEIWSKLDDVLKLNAGDAKQLLRDHSILFDAAHGIAKEAGRTIGLPMSSIRSGTLARASQATRDAMGRGLIKTGNALSFTGGEPATLANVMAKNPSVKRAAAQMIIPKAMMGGFAAPATPGGPDLGGYTQDELMLAAQQAGIDPTQLQSLISGGATEQDLASMLGGFGGTTDDQSMNSMAAGGQMPGSQAATAQQPGMVIPREAMLNAMMVDMQSTGGQNIDKLMKIFEFANYDAINNTAGTEMTADQKKSISKLDSVEASLGQLEQMLTQAGGGQGVVGAIKRNVGSLIPGAASESRVYEGFRNALIAPLARAISGEVGVLTDRDIKRAEGLLPKLSDTPHEAQMRIDSLRQVIAERRNLIYGNEQYAGSSDTDALLEQLLGGFSGVK